MATHGSWTPDQHEPEPLYQPVAEVRQVQAPTEQQIQNAWPKRAMLHGFAGAILPKAFLFGTVLVVMIVIGRFLLGSVPELGLPDVPDIRPATEQTVEQKPIIIEQLITEAEFCGAEVTAVLKQSVSEDHGWVPRIVAGSKLEGVVYGRSQACLNTLDAVPSKRSWLPDEDVTIELPDPTVQGVSIIWPETDPASCSAGLADRIGSFFGDGDACDSVRDEYNVEAHEALIEGTAKSGALRAAQVEYGKHLLSTAQAFGYTGNLTFTVQGAPFNVFQSVADEVPVVIAPTRLEQTDRGDGTCEMHDAGWQGPCIPQDHQS